MIVLDTNVLSEPLKPAPDAGMMKWLAAQSPATLFITTITVAEMLVGIEKMPAGRKRKALAEALDLRLFPLFAGRTLGFDFLCARAFATVVASANAAGNDIDFADASIAAIAIANEYVLATRNVRDFRGTGVRLLNPWTQEPDP